jgi:Zn-dependent protease with chaperone function
MLGSVVVVLAAILRPNALDRAVDHIPAALLLSQPAGALVDHARQLAAVRLEHWLLPGWFFSVFAQVVVLAYFWQSGGAARLREWLRSRFENEVFVRFLYGASLALIGRLASFFPDFYVLRVQRVMGLSDELLRTWIAQWIPNTLITMIVVGIVVTIVISLVSRTHQWYIYTIVGIFAVSFAVAYIGPYVAAPFFGAYRTLPSGLAAALDRVKESAGNDNVPVVVEVHTHSDLGTAFIQGLGGSVRIVITEPLIAASPIDELQYITAYQLGLIAAGAPWKLALDDALFFIFGTAIAVGIADRIPFRRDDDPLARLALVGALLGIVYIVIAPIDNAILRSFSSRAERYALAATGSRIAAVRSIVRETDQRMEEVCPDVMARLFMSNTLDPSTRISILTGVPRNCPR